MKKIIVMLFLISILVLSGCNTNSTTKQDPSSSSQPTTTNPTVTQNTPLVKPKILDKEPTYIGNFRAQTDGEDIELIFSLYDDNHGFMSNGGIAKARIVSDDGTTVYTGSHNIAKEDFGTFTQTLTQQEFTATSWKILASEIKKSSDTSGKVFLDFTTNGGTSFKELDTTLYGLPEYTTAELSALADTEFNKNAIDLNLKKTMDDYISVEVTKIGIMNLKEYSTTKKYIRADIIVKNIGDAKISYFSPNPVILGNNNNQYEKAYVSTSSYSGAYDTGDIYPGVIKKGALFFEITDSTPLDLKELIIETGLSSYSKKSRNIGDGQSLLYNDEYVFKYDLTSVQLK